MNGVKGWRGCKPQFELKGGASNNPTALAQIIWVRFTQKIKKTLEVIWGLSGKHAGDASGSGLASLGSRVITKHLNSSFSSSKDDTLFQYSSSFKSQNVFLTFNFSMKNFLDIRRSTAQLIGNRGVITLPGTFNSNITLPGTSNSNITLVLKSWNYIVRCQWIIYCNLNYICRYK